MGILFFQDTLAFDDAKGTVKGDACMRDRADAFVLRSSSSDYFLSSKGIMLINPKRVFLIFVLMMALFPMPLVSSSAAFASAWAVLGIRKAVLVLFVSMGQLAAVTLGAMIEAVGPILSIPGKVSTATATCQNESCMVSVVASAESNLRLILLTELRAGFVVFCLWTVSIALTYFVVLKIRRSCSPIIRSRWGLK